ncbi:MAG: polysaccharide biosynthesis C-terminal domain-containing protein [Candidatus Atribacteria bacterium]|nr:polysaccharide biosynthesis C-terminal domain-containing protein [Candidatus Atribacteria bacterium]
MSSRIDFAKDAIVYGLGTGLKKFIGIFLLPFYTRALSVEEYGILGTVGAFSMFFSAVLNLGLDSATGYYYFKPQEDTEKGRILFTHFVIRIIGIVPPLILSFFSTPLSKILFGTTKYNWIVFASIMLVPIDLLMSEQSHIYRYLRKPWSYNIITIVKSFVNIGIGISLVVILRWGVWGAQIASITSSSIVIIGSFIIYTRRFYNYAFSFYWAKRMINFGFPLIWAGLATWVYNSSDRFFLLHYADVDEIGYYSIGTIFSQPIGLINMAVQMSFGVLFFKQYHEEFDPDKPASKKLAIAAYDLYLSIAVVLAGSLSVMGPILVNFVTTPEYINGALAIPFLTFSLIYSQSYQTVAPGITLAEKNWYYTFFTILTALVNIGLNFIFIPKWGFVGASATTLCSFMIYAFLKIYIANKYFRIDYPFSKYIALLIITSAISIIYPIAELVYKMELSLVTKIITVLFICSLPFIFKLISINKILSLLKLKTRNSE